MATIPRSYAPWSGEEVDSLNGFQRSGAMHPLTCPSRGDGQHVARPEVDLGTLTATSVGWICPDCDYRQNRAHEFMVNGEWRRHEQELRDWGFRV